MKGAPEIVLVKKNDEECIIDVACIPRRIFYSQLSPCGHRAIMDTLIIWPAAKLIPGKNNLQTFERNKLSHEDSR